MKRGGFTILEMLVVIGITVLLSSLAISYNRSSGRQLSVFREEARMVNLVNRAKVLAMERFNEPPADGVSVCGVGFRTENAKDFLLFQDFDASGNCDNSDYAYSGPDEDIENFTLGDQIEFTGDAAAGLEVMFIPPHLRVTSTQAFPVSFQIVNTQGSESVTVSVSAAGQVTIQD